MSPSDVRASRYTTTAIVLHWGIAVLLIFEFARGWWMQDIPKQPVGPRVDAYNLHKSFGMLLLGLTFLRLGWRIRHAPPPLPMMPAWRGRLAIATHVALYVSTIVVPLSGFLGSVFSGFPVKLFGVTLPSLAPPSVALKDLMSTIHLSMTWVLAAATLLHVAGALAHGFAADGLLARIGIGAPSATKR